MRFYLSHLKFQRSYSNYYSPRSDLLRSYWWLRLILSITCRLSCVVMFLFLQRACAAAGFTTTCATCSRRRSFGTSISWSHRSPNQYIRDSRRKCGSHKGNYLWLWNSRLDQKMFLNFTFARVNLSFIYFAWLLVLGLYLPEKHIHHSNSSSFNVKSLVTQSRTILYCSCTLFYKVLLEPREI